MLPRRVRSTGMSAFYAITSLLGNLGPILVRPGPAAWDPIRAISCALALLGVCYACLAACRCQSFFWF